MFACLIFSPSFAGWIVTDGSKLQVNTGFFCNSDLTIQENGEFLLFGKATIEGTFTNEAGAEGFLILHGSGSLINSTQDVDATFRLSEYTQQQWHLISSPVRNQDPFFLFENQASSWLLYLQQFNETDK